MENLQAIRAERDNDKQYKKQRDIAAKKYGHMRSSLGFENSAMLGMTAQDLVAGEHTNPASFMMSKQKEAQSSMQTTMYDDTGRGYQALKVQRLLERAKKVIDKEALKEMNR